MAEYGLFEDYSEKLGLGTPLTAASYHFAVIYNDTPRPSFWRHPIRWWKWKPAVVAFLDLHDEPDAVQDGVKMWFGNLKVTLEDRT